MFRKLAIALICALLALTPALAEDVAFSYRFADAGEAAGLLLSNRAYYEGLNQNDLNFRMQKLGATLEELEAFAAAQTLDFTDAEKAAIDGAMAAIEAICRERGYALPAVDSIVFAKTTMREECGAGAYTHGTQIYLGQYSMDVALSKDPEDVAYFRAIVAHELFHCLTRNHPDFRADMYAILGFKVADADYDFAPAVRERIISNPDVERHNSCATFDINGEMVDCAVVFTTARPFQKPGDSFFDGEMAGLVPVDDPGTMYTADDAANFWDVFGRNTDYVVDPEEALAENFSYTIIYGPDELEFKTPEIIEAIDRYLLRKP